MQAAELVSERGRVVMISQVHGEAMPPIDDPIMQKGASLIGTYVNSKPYKLRRSRPVDRGRLAAGNGQKTESLCEL